MARAYGFFSSNLLAKGLSGTSWKTVALMIVALSTIGVWVNLVGHSPLFLESIIDTGYYAAGRKMYLLGRVLIAACIFFSYRFFEKRIARFCTSACVLLCVFTSLHGFNMYQTLLDPISVELTCQFFMGICYPFIVSIFYFTSAAKLRINGAIFVIAVSQVVEQISSNGLDALLNQGTVTILCIALPLVSCLAFLKAHSRSSDISHEKIVGPAIAYNVILVLSAFLALAMASAISTVGFWSNVRVDYYTEDRVWAFVQTLIASALVLVLSYFTIYRPARYPLSVRYQAPFLVVVAAFFCVSIQSLLNIELVVLDTAILSVEFFAHVFAWAAMAAAIQKLNIPPLKLIGSAQLFHAGIWFLWESLKGSSTLYSNIVLSVICYILIVITALAAPVINGFFLRRKTLSMENSNQLMISGEVPYANSVSSSDIANDLESRCNALGMYYGLTQREKDVLTLIAQGRSQIRIEEELMLSRSTVKTHTSNIFSKMRVHSRQEIIDLVLEKSEKG